VAAAVTGVAAWALATASLWLHALAGVPGDYLGQGYPLYPGLPVTLATLARDAALATLPVLPVVALARRFRLRLAVLPVVAGLWLAAASTLIWPFVIDFGTTWAGTEPLRELVLHPVHTPLALGILLALTLALLTPRRG
jgi:hypothetical protein